VLLVVSVPKIFQRDNSIFYEVEVIYKNEIRKKLWYRVYSNTFSTLSISSDAALVGLLLPAMHTGEDIFLQGSVSERLFYNLSGPYQKLIQQLIPNLTRIKIYADSFLSIECKTNNIGTAFSGGVDSFSVLANNYYKTSDNASKISHLLFNNVGSHGVGEQAEDIFFKRYQELKSIMETTKLPFIKINSNLQTFYNPEINFEQTHTLRNISIALLFQGSFKRFIYASGIQYKDVFVDKSKNMDTIDLITLPMLSTENFELVSNGSEYSRIEKTLQVSSLHDSYSLLDVCTNPSHNQKVVNCSVCPKCMRTIFTLELHNVLDLYDRVFNIELYKKNRKKYFVKLLLEAKTDPLAREIILFTKEKNFSFPFEVYMDKTFYKVKKILKKVKQRLI